MNMDEIFDKIDNNEASVYIENKHYYEGCNDEKYPYYTIVVKGKNYLKVFDKSMLDNADLMAGIVNRDYFGLYFVSDRLAKDKAFLNRISYKNLHKFWRDIFRRYRYIYGSSSWYNGVFSKKVTLQLPNYTNHPEFIINLLSTMSEKASQHNDIERSKKYSKISKNLSKLYVKKTRKQEKLQKRNLKMIAKKEKHEKENLRGKTQTKQEKEKA